MKKSTLQKISGGAASAARLVETNGTKRPLPQFLGAKSRAVWHIINQIPPHETFVEAFAGTATITRQKRPASLGTIVIDSDAAVCEALIASFGGPAGVTVICDDAISWLDYHRKDFTRQTVIYCDPPYLFDVRADRRKRYGHEFGDEWLHGELLAVLSRIACQEVPVLISGYRSDLYERELGHWRRVDYRAMTRGGPRIESLWCSFDEPAELHDYRFAGINFRERERLKRKRSRWLARLQRMCPRERAVLIAAIDEWRRQPSSE